MLSSVPTSTTTRASGGLLVISQQAGLQRVGDIAKYFGDAKGTAKDAAVVMSAAAFPLPFAYTERASKDLVKGVKPPRVWDLKEGDGNPVLVLRLAACLTSIACATSVARQRSPSSLSRYGSLKAEQRTSRLAEMFCCLRLRLTSLQTMRP